MVGGLVQQKQVRLRHQRADQGHPLALAAGQGLHRDVKIHKTHPGQHGLGLALHILQMGVIRVVPADAFQYRITGMEPWILRQIPDIQAVSPDHGAAIRLLQPRRDPQKRGLAGPVDADQPYFFPFLNGKIRVVKQEPFRIRFGQMFYGQQAHAITNSTGQ